MLGVKAAIFQLRPVDQIVKRHQAIEIHGTGHLVQVIGRESELTEQIRENLLGAIVRGLQPHGIAVAARGQLAFDRAQQVIDFFLLDEQVAVAGDPELVAAAHAHAGEQIGHERLDDGAEKHEMPAAEFVGQAG